VALGNAAAAPETASLKVTHCSHVLPDLSQDNSEQLKKIVRGDAQFVLAHVGLHETPETAGLSFDEAHQVPA